MKGAANEGMHKHLEMYQWAKDLFPICRSLTGEGNRQTLRYLQQHLPEMEIIEAATGTKAFDWEVPPEWEIREGWIRDGEGKKIVDFRDHNLHVIGYSAPVDREIDLEELQKHLYSRPDMPEVIPYVTSYYERRWGFCLSHRQREALKPGKYRVYIDSAHREGSMSYGEVILPGEGEEEIFLSTYICHPSLANNEISGPVVTTALGRWLRERKKRRYTYRIVYVPETIGSIYYLSRHLKEMKERVKAGFVVTCVGDDRGYSYLPSRKGDTLADRAARHVLDHHAGRYRRYRFQQRGSDERQYCSAGVDLPVALMMRSKFHEYQEYHTSADDLSLISPEGLGGAFELYKKALRVLEANARYESTVLCEPQLGRRGLYPTLGANGQTRKPEWLQIMREILSYADGRSDLIEIAEEAGFSAVDAIEVVEKLLEEGLLVRRG